MSPCIDRQSKPKCEQLEIFRGGEASAVENRVNINYLHLERWQSGRLRPT
jgi:hypothetical protein